MKKIIVTVVAVILLMGSTLDVSAAGLRDVFSAKYYADQYADLKAAFGYDEEMLYQHFLKYGLKEGRNMSPILDVREYREKYADLDAAFGDNWDAYVQHFLDFGINENRDNGTNFDVKTYIEAYGDIAAAYGNDFEAVMEHYLTFGMEENRTKGDPVVYQESLKAEQNSGNDSEGGAEIDDVVNIYDENGRLIKVIYKNNDSIDCYDLYEYDDNGLLMIVTQYNSSDVVVQVRTFEYENGVLKTETGCLTGGFVNFVKEYNEAGCCVKKIEYNGSGATTSEYDDEGDLVKSVTALADGTVLFGVEYVKNAQGEKVRRNFWNRGDGSYIVGIYDSNDVQLGQEFYDVDGNLTESIDNEYLDNGYSKLYWKDANGNIMIEAINDEKGNNIENTWYDADGNVTRKAYNKFNDNGEVIWSKEVKQDGSYSERENDADGKTMKQCFYSANNELNSYVIFIYNDKNQCVRDETYNQNDELQGYTLYTYDENGELVSEKYVSANTRDESYDLVSADGMTCVVGYDSSIVEIHGDDGDNIAEFWPVDQEAFGPFGCVTIKSGCNSYEEYKEELLDRISTERGVAKDKIWVSEYENCTVNGHTYYALRWGYSTENDEDEQKVIYVKINEDAYFEVSDIYFNGPLYFLVQTVIYIESVN